MNQKPNIALKKIHDGKSQKSKSGALESQR